MSNPKTIPTAYEELSGPMKSYIKIPLTDTVLEVKVLITRVVLAVDKSGRPIIDSENMRKVYAVGTAPIVTTLTNAEYKSLSE